MGNVFNGFFIFEGDGNKGSSCTLGSTRFRGGERWERELIITKESNYSKKVRTEVRVGTLKMRQVLNWSI